MAGIKIPISTDEARHAVKELRSDLKNLGMGAQQAEAATKHLQSRLMQRLGADKSEAAIQRLTSSLKLNRLEVMRLHASTGNLGGAMAVMGRGISSAVGLVTSLKAALIGLGAVMVVKKSLGTFREYEVALVDLAQVTDESLDAIEKRIQALPKNLGSGTELLKGYYQVLSAGITDSGKAMEVMTATAKLGKSAHIDQASAVKAVTSIMDAYKGEVRDATDASDLLFKIAAQGKSEVRELIPIIGGLVTMSSAMAVSTYEMSAAFSQVSQMAGSTSEAATQMEAIFTALISPTDEMNKLFKEFYGIQGAIAKLGFTEVLKRIAQEAGKSTEALKKLLGGRKEATIGMLSLMQEDFAGYEKFLKEAGDRAGLSEKAYSEWSKTLDAMSTKFQNVLLDKFRIMGKELAPMTMEVMDKLGVWLDEHDDQLISITDKLITLISGLGTLGGGVLDVFSSIQTRMELLAWALDLDKNHTKPRATTEWYKSQLAAQRQANIPPELSGLTLAPSHVPERSAHMLKDDISGTIALEEKRRKIIEDLKLHPQEPSAEEKAAAKQKLQAQKELDEAIVKSSKTVYETEIYLLRRNVDEWKKAGADKIAAEQYFTDQQKRLIDIRDEAEKRGVLGRTGAWGTVKEQMDEELKYHDAVIEKMLEEQKLELKKINQDFLMKEDPYAPLKAGLKDYVDNVGNDFELVQKAAENTAKAMERGFGDLFFNVMTGQFNNLRDVALQTLEEIVRATTDMLAQMTAKMAASGLLKIATRIGMAVATSGTSEGVGAATAGNYGAQLDYFSFHQGGVVGMTRAPIRTLSGSLLNDAPRLHSGLRADEFPAILQRGETVTPAASQSTQKVNVTYNINALDAGSFVSLCRKNPTAITAPMIEELRRGNRSLKSAMRK